MSDDRTMDTRAYDGRRTPALDRLASVATELGDKLCQRIVFIGASILPLLENEGDVFGVTRPTTDVDAILATTSYAQKGMVEDELRALRFRNDTRPGAHADRWVTPRGTMFDLVSCGDHFGANGSPHDRFAVESAVERDLPPRIRHASGVGFLTLKCGAFRDRGRRSPLESKDLMDIVTLAATRRSLPDEVRNAPEEIQGFLAAEVRQILDSPTARSAIPSHVADQNPLADDIEENVMTRLRKIVAPL
jgi:hypothetical protein